MSNRHISQSRLQRENFDKSRGLSSLRRCGGSREEEELKERIADEMLRAAPSDPVRPVHTEHQLNRQVQSRCVLRIDAIADRMVSERPSQTAMDELKFLMKLTPLTKRERFFMRGWVLGWTQVETAARWWEQFGPDGRYTVSRVLRGAVLKCSENAPVCFSAISRHAVYRRPSHRSETWRMISCAYCKEPFIRSFGVGPYCSVGCHEAAGRGE